MRGDGVWPSLGRILLHGSIGLERRRPPAGSHTADAIVSSGCRRRVGLAIVTLRIIWHCGYRLGVRRRIVSAVIERAAEVIEIEELLQRVLSIRVEMLLLRTHNRRCKAVLDSVIEERLG